MSEKIYIVPKTKEHKKNIVLPDARTTKYVDSLVKISQPDKDNLVEDAISILSHCIPPSVPDNITNIAVGYVQSGKTMSFTLLTALAADNGYKVVIYLTGTKINLQGQTYDRLRDDLKIGDDDSIDYILFEDNQEASFGTITYIKDILSSDLLDSVLLFPILKHYSHISKLAKIFSDVTLKPILDKIGVLIIDDEADQASFNTYARKNASGPEWGKKDKFSKTYASIVELRNAFPSHSYVQYTATPQAAFLIDNADILSPQYQTVLRPGSSYTGGLFFFEQHKEELIRIIPPEEVYHKDRNPLTECPKSLISAVQQFIISIVIVCYIKKQKKYLSMMIHQDGSRRTNELFDRWISGLISDWKDFLKLDEDDPSRNELVCQFVSAYEEITKYMEDAPSFDSVMNIIPMALLFTKAYLIQGNGESIDWKKTQKKGHILVGAEMLGRGFTIENLSMSYMSRTSKSKGNSDTIEQRCRFFGYKLSYIDICRVFLPEQSIEDYTNYVTFEEIMRANLSQCESVKEFTKNAPSLIISSKLNPTRSNILSKEIVRNKLTGWRQMKSLDYIEENKIVFENALNQLKDNFIYTKTYEGHPVRNHRYVQLDMDSFIDFFKQIQYKDLPNKTRKTATLQYLVYLKEKKKLDYVYLYEMSYDFLREREFVDGKLEVKNLLMGDTKDGKLPGDKRFFFDDSLCFQIHHFKIENNATIFSRKEMYNIVVYYPKKFENDFVYVEQEDTD